MPINFTIFGWSYCFKMRPSCRNFFFCSSGKVTYNRVLTVENTNYYVARVLIRHLQQSPYVSLPCMFQLLHLLQFFHGLLNVEMNQGPENFLNLCLLHEDLHDKHPQNCLCLFYQPKETSILSEYFLIKSLIIFMISDTNFQSSYCSYQLNVIVVQFPLFTYNSSFQNRT